MSADFFPFSGPEPLSSKWFKKKKALFHVITSSKFDGYTFTFLPNIKKQEGTLKKNNPRLID